ncbi:MAG: hypothetical protein BWY11_01198 [Firmicutes bacterium ADurb.Bin182]|nr:MAG: hypothetical protein BWY11_01198 [Firmicutes bacterium ADurb.Bin182]
MVNYKPSARSSVIAAVAAAAILLVIFIFPNMIVKDLSEKVSAKTRSTIEALYAKDWDMANTDMEFVANTLAENEHTLMLFMDHRLVDELIAAARGCLHLVRKHDSAQVFVELEFIINRIEYLAETEKFMWGNLL